MESKQRILDYLQEHGSMTKMDCIRDLGYVNPAARITDLIRAGHPIKKVTEYGPNRYGDQTHWTRYVWKGERTQCP